MKHVEESYTTVQSLLKHPSADMRKAAVTAVSQLCIAVANVAQDSNDPEAQKGHTTWFLDVIQSHVCVQKSIAVTNAQTFGA